MAFKTRFDDGHPCPKCKANIGAGELVQYADADRKILEHMDCEDSEEPGRTEGAIRWENVTEESLERTERQQLEELQVAPVGPQGICGGCFLELPRSGVCGTC